MKKKVLILALSFLALSCVEKVTTVPFGSTTGIIKGYVLPIISQTPPFYPANKSGIKISFEGTNFFTFTDSTGMWIMKKVPAGTYTIVYEKDSFATIKSYSNRFVGIDTLLIGSQYLDHIIYCTLQIDSVSKFMDEYPIYHDSIYIDSLGVNHDTVVVSIEKAGYEFCNLYFTTKFSGRGYYPYYMILFSRDPSISIEQPLSYQMYFDWYYPTNSSYDTSGQTKLQIPKDAFQYKPLYLRNGESVYLAVYAGGGNVQYDYYLDLESSKNIFTGFSPHHSKIFKITLPK